MNNLRAEVALGAMRMLAEGSANVNIQAFGLDQNDFDLVAGPYAWTSIDRPKVSAVLQTLTTGTLDVIGVTRYPVSAEYMAGVVAMFVMPANFMTACDWLPACLTNEDLGAGQRDFGGERVTPQQLFALVLQIYSGDDGVLRQQFFGKHPSLAPQPVEDGALEV